MQCVELLCFFYYYSFIRNRQLWLSSSSQLANPPSENAGTLSIVRVISYQCQHPGNKCKLQLPLSFSASHHPCLCTLRLFFACTALNSSQENTLRYKMSDRLSKLRVYCSCSSLGESKSKLPSIRLHCWSFATNVSSLSGHVSTVPYNTTSLAFLSPPPFCFPDGVRVGVAKG
jgi:hypothetical protein